MNYAETIYTTIERTYSLIETSVELLRTEVSRLLSNQLSGHRLLNYTLLTFNQTASRDSQRKQSYICHFITAIPVSRKEGNIERKSKKGGSRSSYRSRKSSVGEATPETSRVVPTAGAAAKLPRKSAERMIIRYEYKTAEHVKLLWGDGLVGWKHAGG